jgi:hypothetical protein
VVRIAASRGQEQLRAEGYDTEVDLVGSELRWGRGGLSSAIEVAEVERLFRFEGPSDPGDEMIVFGLCDPGSGTKGVLASAFGPSADPEVLDQLVGLTQRHRPA